MGGEELEQAKTEYERFKLTWMLGHGFTLANLVHELEMLRKDSEPDLSMEDLFADWQLECGFGSQIWPCFEEFLEVEYKEMQAARNHVEVLRPQAERPGFNKGKYCEESVIAQLKNQPRQGPKKTAPKKSAEKEI